MSTAPGEMRRRKVMRVEAITPILCIHPPPLFISNEWLVRLCLILLSIPGANVSDIHYCMKYNIKTPATKMVDEVNVNVFHLRVSNVIM